MACRTRSSSLPSSAPQAKLLRERGDLMGQRNMFNIKLQKANPLALRAEHPLDRLGMDIKSNVMPDRLLVADIDRGVRRNTPVAYFNDQEERRSNRGQGERHASFALLPGDRLSSVNEVNGKTAMLAELVDSVDDYSPKAINLAISRNIADVMAPSPLRPVRNISSAPATSPTSFSLPKLRPESGESTALKSPPRHSHSRASSVGSVSCSRSRSGSKRYSTKFPPLSCGSALGISVSLSNAGRCAMAF